MARTTATAVQGVLVSDYDATISLTPFIETASAIVDDLVEALTLAGLVLSTTRAELIERWVAAHCYATNDRPLQAAKTGDAQATYQGKTGLYLDATYYGQMALSLDASGLLKKLTSGMGGVVGGRWIGKTETEQLSYEQRN